MGNESKCTILLVEDESLIALSEKMILEQYGYKVIITNSGEEALKILHKTFDINLILMDINLGEGMDGTQAAQQILEKRNLPIIFLTSHTEEEFVDKAREITRYGYVIKNAGNFVLKSSIEMALELFEKNDLLEKNMNLLKINENLLNEAQSLAHIGHWYWDTITEKLHWSDEIFSIFGVDKNIFVVSAENFEKTIHPDDRESFLKERQIMLDTESGAEMEHRIIRPSGEVRYVVERAKVIRNKHQKVEYVMGTVQDITERKQAEEALQRSKILLESSIESPKDMIILSLDHNYRYLFFNKIHKESMRDIFGTQPQIGDCIFDHMKGKDDIKKVKAHYDRALAGEGHSEIEEYGQEPFRFYYEIQYNPIIDAKKKIIGVTAFAQNVSDRIKAKEAQQRETSRFMNILNAIPDGVYIVSKEYDIEYINPAIKKVFGSIKGRKCYSYFHDRKKVCPWCKNKEVFAGKSVEWEWSSPKNNRHYTLFDTPFMNAEGRISKFEIFHDITALKNAEQALQTSFQEKKRITYGITTQGKKQL